LFRDLEGKSDGVLDGNLDPLELSKNATVGKNDPAEDRRLGLMDFRSLFDSFEFLDITGREGVSCRDGFSLPRDSIGRADFFP
jgi:hypothetical protein